MSDNDFQTWRDTCAPDILGESRPVLRCLEMIRRVGPSESSVLLTGETGTGKELFARTVHRASSRASKPFVAVNCAAIPDSLIEAELFGHLRGAFTGAEGKRAGRFAAAHGGTLFLDEIGDLPLSAQAKLLRVLEQRAICPLGSDTEVPIDVRIVAATHRDLEAMVAAGTFRSDLYFRLSVMPIELPPLRSRGTDIIKLAEAAVRRGTSRRAAPTFDATARAALLSYPWPGNVRELNHMVERAVLLADGDVLTAADLTFGTRSMAQGTAPIAKIDLPAVSLPAAPAPAPAAAAGEDPSLDLRSALEGLERRMIHEALARAQGNRTEAAALLGLNRTTLVEKLRKYA
ncbi:MAG TPA: sigma 54-interacting transcriptional regulator [Kofleriaceae bacterium]|nr:sigma 54-interacting transcriptional regulator [Kofleriaceae bacterium]